MVVAFSFSFYCVQMWTTWFIIIYYDLLYLLTWFGWTSAGQCNVLVGVQHLGLPTWSLKCIHMLFCCIKWNTDDKWIWIVTVLHFTILSKSSSRPLLSYLLVCQLGPISPSLNWINYLSGYVVTTAGLTLVLHWLTVWTPLASNKPQQSSCLVGFPVSFFCHRVHIQIKYTQSTFALTLHTVNNEVTTLTMGLHQTIHMQRIN